jgi:hypothetical protein
VNGSTQAEGARARWWWLAVAVAIAAFAIGFGITKLAGGGSTVTQTVPPPGITFQQAHVVPLHISRRQFQQRIKVPPARTVRRHSKPPVTCLYYPLTDQAGRYVFCFHHDELILAYGGPTG